MKRVGFFLTAVVAVALLVGVRPLSGNEQFPRGLMSSAPLGGNQGGTCTIETRPLSFTAYDPLAEAAVHAIAQVIYFCTDPHGNGGGPGSRASQDKGIRIEMDRGLGTSSQERQMLGPGLDHLSYDIYLDATFQTVWGDGSNGTDVYLDKHPPVGRPVVVPVFGRIFGRQDIPAGQYVDQVQVRIVF